MKLYLGQCQEYKLMEERSMLDDAMSLLMSHDKHNDNGWIDDYEELIKRYDRMDNIIYCKRKVTDHELP